MKRFPLATMVPLLCLVSFAASASAECAWVLWLRGAKISGDTAFSIPPEPREAFMTKRECDSGLVWQEAQEADRLKGDPNSALRKYYTCLPDTVDPRGPKGK